jgi:hypothetical protein
MWHQKGFGPIKICANCQTLNKDMRGLTFGYSSKDMSSLVENTIMHCGPLLSEKMALYCKNALPLQLE